MEQRARVNATPNRPESNLRHLNTAHSPRRKISNACQRCRRKKIKCSGLSPCQNCFDHAARCTYEETGKKVIVSERYLEQLKSTISRLEEQVASKTLASDSPLLSPLNITRKDQTSSRDTQQHAVHPNPAVSDARTSHGYAAQPSLEISANIRPLEDTVPPVQNPLTSSRSFFVIDSSGKQRYLGSSSSWSFSWQVRKFLEAATGSDAFIDLIPSSEEDTYSMASATTRDSLSSLDAAFPSRDYAEYLTNTTLFHLEPMYHLFVKASFMQNLEECYDALELGKKPPTSLWMVQFFLVVAFGKVFLRRGASSLGPPGAIDFLHAMKLRSGMLDLWEEPSLGIEILCLVSLYLLTADIRSAAYTFIGQAMRMALSLGMNRDPPPGSLERTEQERRRRLWWTVYIIDKKLSMNMGSPPSIEAKDIDVQLPRDNDLGISNSALILHAKLEMLEGMIMNSAYGINSTFNKAFIMGIEQVFSTMTNLAESFAGKFDFSLSHPGEVSRIAATLHLIYYQCTIMATRPIMFALVQQRLTANNPGPRMVKTVSEPVTVLLKTCIRAATTIIKILTKLQEQDLVEPFLPFDLQSVFSAAFILTLATATHPCLSTDKSCIAKADEILVWMCSKGNMPANSRRKELTELRELAMKIEEGWNENSYALAPGVENFDPVWNAVDIEGDLPQLNNPMSYINIMGSDFLSGGIPGGLEDFQWFWAGDN